MEGVCGEGDAGEAGGCGRQPPEDGSGSRGQAKVGTNLSMGIWTVRIERHYLPGMQTAHVVFKDNKRSFFFLLILSTVFAIPFLFSLRSTIVSHSRFFSPPSLPTTARGLPFYRANTPTLSSLVHSRGVA